MNWKERLLELDDLSIILEWYNDEELHNIADVKPFKRYTIEELREYWTEKLARSYASYHVIIVRDEVIGRVGLKKTKYDDTYVMEYSILIGVSNLYSKGLGTEITKYFISKSFLDSDIQAVVLQVREDNKRAIRCYEKAGFKKVKSYIENEVKVYDMHRIKNEKTALDFESIRKLLRLIVNDPADRSDDLINPVHLYVAYSSLFEELNQGNCLQLNATDTVHTIENIVKEKADKIASKFDQINNEQREAIRNAIIIATLSVHTAYVQMLAKRYVTATLFLQNLDVKP